jgi:hypothetical protein
VSRVAFDHLCTLGRWRVHEVIGDLLYLGSERAAHSTRVLFDTSAARPSAGAPMPKRSAVTHRKRHRHNDAQQREPAQVCGHSCLKLFNP